MKRVYALALGAIFCFKAEINSSMAVSRAAQVVAGGAVFCACGGPAAVAYGAKVAGAKIATALGAAVSYWMSRYTRDV